MKFIKGFSNEKGKELAELIRQISPHYLTIDLDNVIATEYSLHLVYGEGEKNYLLYSPSIYGEEVKKVMGEQKLSLEEISSCFNEILERLKK